MQPPPAKTVSPELDHRNLIRLDGVVLGRFVPERGTIEIVDKDQLRSRCRGTCYVEVSVAALVALVKDDGA